MTISRASCSICPINRLLHYARCRRENHLRGQGDQPEKRVRSISVRWVHLSDLWSNIAKIETIVVGSELEALIQMNLIKEHRPFFNVRLKDDKRYPYIRSPAQAYPRFP